MGRFSRSALLLVVGLVVLFGGCAPELLSRRATRGAVRGGAEGLADLDPALRKRLRDVYLGDASLQDAARDLTRALIAGAADGARAAQLGPLTDQLVAAALGALSAHGSVALKDFVQATGPELERALRDGIRGAMLEAGASLRQVAERDLTVATRVLLTTAIDATAEALTRHMEGMDARAYARERLAPAAGAVTRTMMREAVLGLSEGVDQIMDDGPDGQRQVALRNVMYQVGAGLAEGMRVGVTDNSNLTTLLTAGVLVLALLLVGAIVGSFVLWRRYQNTTKPLLVFARKLDDAQKSTDDVNLRSLRDSIVMAHTEAKRDEWLKRFLTRRGLAPDAPTGSGAASSSAPPKTST